MFEKKTATIKFAGKRRGVFFKKYFLVLALASFIAVSCDSLDIFSRPYVATVNGAKIYLDEYQLRLNQQVAMMPKDLLKEDPRYLSRLEEEVLDAMITEKIISLRAEELNISVGTSELDEKINEIKEDYGEDFVSLLAQQNIRYDQWKEQIRRDMLIHKLVEAEVNEKIRVSNDEAEDYYNDNRNNYRVDARVKVAQIVVRDLDSAKEILERLQAGEDFAELAASVSIGPEASRGGDLGYITRQIMPEPLDEVIFALPENKISRVVQSPYGFHIFKVLDKEPVRLRRFEEVKDEIIAEIHARKQEVAFINWLNSLKLSAEIKKENTVLRKKVNRQL
ncbi:MAG TPA: hypothetical protein ENN23_09745 [Deltaproteobacteria bacterium]|nr:hypothetical protein [Deltaproteobacteria bacterium]